MKQKIKRIKQRLKVEEELTTQKVKKFKYCLIIDSYGDP